MVGTRLELSNQITGREVSPRTITIPDRRRAPVPGEIAATPPSAGRRRFAATLGFRYWFTASFRRRLNAIERAPLAAGERRGNGVETVNVCARVDRMYTGSGGRAVAADYAMAVEREKINK